MYWASKLARTLGVAPAPQLHGRFSEPESRDDVSRILSENSAVSGDASIVDYLICNGEILCFQRGDELIRQADQDDHVFFLITGEVDIQIGSQLGSTREAPNQVGELAAINPGKPRSATVIAKSHEVATLCVPGKVFQSLYVENQDFRQRLDVEMNARFRERIIAGQVAKRNNSFLWFLISIGIGAAFFCLSWFALIPPSWSSDARIAYSGLICVLSFLFTLLHNPAFFWRRCCGLIILAMLGVFALNGFVSVEATQGLGSLQLVMESGGRETNWKLTLINQGTFLIALLICAFMDRKINPD